MLRMIGILLGLTSAFCSAPKGLQTYSYKLVTDSASGSGVFIDETLVLTAAHVVGAQDSVSVLECGSLEIKALVLRTDPKSDLALLQLLHPCPPAAIVPLSPKNALLGDSVSVIGFPRGWARTIHHGIVSLYEIFSVEAVRYLMLVDGNVIGGNSGGPVLDADRELVGIVSSRICLPSAHANEPPICYAGVIPVSTIKSFLTLDN